MHAEANRIDNKKNPFNWSLAFDKLMFQDPGVEVTFLEGDELDSAWMQWDLATKLLDTDYGKLT